MNMEIFHEMAMKAKDGKPIINVCLDEIESLRKQRSTNFVVVDQIVRQQGEIESLRQVFAAMTKERDELLAALENAQDIVSKTAQKAWSLGQTYWQQADSEYQSQWKKTDETQAKFQQVVDDARSAIARVK